MSDYMIEQYEKSFGHIKSSSFWHDEDESTSDKFLIPLKIQKIEDLIQKIDLLKNYLIEFKIIDFIDYKAFYQNITSKKIMYQNDIIINIQTEIMKESKELNINIDLENLNFFESILNEILKTKKILNKIKSN